MCTEFQADDDFPDIASNAESEESIFIRIKSEALAAEVDPLTDHSLIVSRNESNTSRAAKPELDFETIDEMLPDSGTPDEIPMEMQADCVSVENLNHFRGRFCCLCI